jgi:hypothetical protein
MRTPSEGIDEGGKLELFAGQILCNIAQESVSEVLGGGLGHGLVRLAAGTPFIGISAGKFRFRRPRAVMQSLVPAGKADGLRSHARAKARACARAFAHALLRG